MGARVTKTEFLFGAYLSRRTCRLQENLLKGLLKLLLKLGAQGWGRRCPLGAPRPQRTHTLESVVAHLGQSERVRAGFPGQGTSEVGGTSRIYGGKGDT